MIIVASGSKQSGKDLTCNFILGLRLLQNRVIEDFVISEETNGALFVQENECEYNTGYNRWRKWNSKKQYYNGQNVKVYSFADKLKEMCVDVFGLEYEQVYGTDPQKNTLTKYFWEQMPGLNDTSFAGKTGLMNGREFMEFIGTGLFRRIYDNVWIDATFKQISRDVVFELGQLQCYAPYNQQLFLLNDCRFKNEVLRSKERGAKIIRLARNPFNSQNEVERALDPDKFDWSQFDVVIRNQNYTIRQTLEELYRIVKGWGLVNIEYDFDKIRNF